MATTYYSTEITAGESRRYNEKGVYAVKGTYALTGAFVINDVVQMVKVPNGAKILNIDTYFDDLDTNGTPLIQIQIGDGDTADRFAAANAVAQGGGFLRGIQTYAGFGYEYTADDTIDIKVSTAPATGATTGNIVMIVTMCNDL